MAVLIDPATDEYTDPPNNMRIIVPFLPPSSNKIYVTDWRRKRRFKSREANAFQEEFRARVVPVYLPWISQLIGPEQNPCVLYTVAIDFYFPRKEVINKGFDQLDSKGQRKAKTRYKKMDTGNRLKLVNDCLSDALQIDDSHFFQVGGRKIVAESFGVDPQVHIFLTLRDPRDFGV